LLDLAVGFDAEFVRLRHKEIEFHASQNGRSILQFRAERQLRMAKVYEHPAVMRTSKTINALGNNRAMS